MDVLEELEVIVETICESMCHYWNASARVVSAICHLPLI
jgi:hypothetical protein